MQSHVFWLLVTMHTLMKSSCARTGAARLAANAPTTRKDSTRMILPPDNRPLPAALVGQYRTQVPLPIAAVSHSLFPADPQEATPQRLDERVRERKRARLLPSTRAQRTSRPVGRA